MSSVPRNCVTSHELGTRPMAIIDDKDENRRGNREGERSARVSTRFSLDVVVNERADAGRDGRICLARAKSQARTNLATMRGWSPVC